MASERVDRPGCGCAGVRPDSSSTGEEVTTNAFGQKLSIPGKC